MKKIETTLDVYDGVLFEGTIMVGKVDDSSGVGQEVLSGWVFDSFVYTGARAGLIVILFFVGEGQKFSGQGSGADAFGSFELFVLSFLSQDLRNIISVLINCGIVTVSVEVAVKVV